MVSFNNLQGGTKRVYSVRGGESNGTSDYNQLINKPAINGTILTSTTSTTDLGISGDYGDLTNKPAIEGVELTPTTTLTDLGIDNRTDTMLFDLGLDFNKTILSVTSTTSQDSVANAIDARMPAALHADWKIAGLVKWELKDSSGTRIEAMPSAVFTMEGQTAMRMWFRTPGSENKNVRRFNGAMLLTKR